MPDGAGRAVPARSRGTASHTIRRQPARTGGRGGRGEAGDVNRSKGRRSPMTPLGKSRHLAARMGRWSAPHWKTATFGWLAFVVAAFAIGSVIGTKNLDPEQGRLRRVRSRAERSWPTSSSSRRTRTCSSRAELHDDDPTFRHAVAGRRPRSKASRTSATSTRRSSAGNSGQISADRHAALVQFKLRGTDSQSARTSRPVEAPSRPVAARASLAHRSASSATPASTRR